MPALFVREFLDKLEFILTRNVTPGFEWALEGEGVATTKSMGAARQSLMGFSIRGTTRSKARFLQKEPSLAASPILSRATGPFG